MDDWTIGSHKPGKELRFAVSFTIYKNGSKEFLSVERPKEDKELGDVWGLPATNFDMAKESMEDAVRRGGLEKLNCRIEPIRRIPVAMIQERYGYDLLLVDYECRLVEGEPDVSKATISGTRYVSQKWTSDPRTLKEAAKKGSVCSQLFLFDKGLLGRKELVTKLAH